jgi:hypothetical protein
MSHETSPRKPVTSEPWQALSLCLTAKHNPMLPAQHPASRSGLSNQPNLIFRSGDRPDPNHLSQNPKPKTTPPPHSLPPSCSSITPGSRGMIHPPRESKPIFDLPQDLQLQFLRRRRALLPIVITATASPSASPSRPITRPAPPAQPSGPGLGGYARRDGYSGTLRLGGGQELLLRCIRGQRSGGGGGG